MGTSRCTACGSTLPEGAQFCPRCGAASQPAAVPILDLDAPSGRQEEDDEPRDRTVATVVGVVLGVIALLVVLSIVAGGDDDEQGSEEPAPSTTEPRSTTTLPRPTLEVPPMLTEGEILDPSFGMAAVSIRSNGTVVVADLGTGEERTLERIPVAPVQSAAWVGETFVVKSLGEDLHRLALDGSDAWETLDIDDGLSIEPLWGGPPGLFWMFDPMEEPDGSPGFALVGPEGPVRLLGGQNLNLFNTPTGVIDGQAVVNSPDGIILVGEGGVARRYGYGWVLGSRDPYLVRRSCDDELMCRLVLDDTSTGEATDLGPIDAKASIARALPSPDGTAVAVAERSSRGAAVRVMSVGGDARATFEVQTNDLSFMQWSPVSDGLIWWNEPMRELTAVSWRTGAGAGQPSTVDVSVDWDSGGYVRVFVVPLADLPQGWAPSDE